MRLSSQILVIAASCSMLIFAVGCAEQPPSQEPTKLTANQTQVQVSTEQTEQPEAVEANLPEPNIVFENVVHDFGEVPPGSKNTCEFKFVNQGPGLLKVDKKVRSTCHCTAPSLTKTEYQPGESGAVKVIYRASQRPGTDRRRVYVKSNDKQNPQVTLTIKATIKELVTYEPKRLKLLPNKENADCPDIVIASADDKPFAINGFKSRPECITADYDPNTKGTSFTLKPKVDLKELEKNLKGRVIVSLSRSDTRTIMIPYEALARFTADPARLIAFRAEPGKTIHKTVYILSNYGEALELESVTTNNDVLRVINQERLDASRYKLDVEIVPPKQSDKRYFNGKLTVKIAGGPEVEIPCICSLARKT